MIAVEVKFDIDPDGFSESDFIRELAFTLGDAYSTRLIDIKVVKVVGYTPKEEEHG